MNFWGIIPAAGSGLRFGAEIPKQYLRLGDHAVIAWSVAALLGAPLRKLVVALGRDDRHWSKLDWRGEVRLETCLGGAQRQQSVVNALEALEGRAGNTDWVLIHDAVRPCVRAEDIDKLIGFAAAGGHGGAVLGWPVDNALKRVSNSMLVLDNVERRDCWNAATPQIFQYGVLRASLAAAEAAGTSHVDEAAAVAAAGNPVRMLDCAKDNIKITHEPDLALAADILARREAAVE